MSDTSATDPFQEYLDEILRITDELIAEKVSPEVTVEYLKDAIWVMDENQAKCTLLLAVLDVIRENRARRAE